jgi:carboxypeptidase C (cathepsin A)
MFFSSILPKLNLRHVLLVGIAFLFISWGKLGNHFLYKNKAGNAAYHLAVTNHQLKIDGKLISYQATTGYLPVNGKTDKTPANIFYVAYTTDSINRNSKRPITFVFNGGPGSASIWLHMGSFGPVRVLFKNEKGDAPQQSQYGDNPYSWLGFTDLVFIDPVATGYSRAGEDVDTKQFYNYNTDIATIGEFIHTYLAQHHLESNPKFLAGESYGTVRAVGLADYLQQQYQTKLSGITLISPALNYQLINFHHGNEMPYSYYLPSYAVAAQYHQRLSPELQRLSTKELLTKTAAFAQGTYIKFLNEGDAASQTLTYNVIDSLHYFTGLPKAYLVQVNGRVSDRQFSKALLEDDNQVTGTFDSRFTGTDKNADPSESNLHSLFTTAFDSYIRKDLKYQNNLPYQATTAVGDWNYGADANNSYLDVSETLKKVMNQNPTLKVNVVCGYYDLATPVGSTQYVIRHLGLKPKLRDNISLNYYHSGHMIYISKTANAKFKTDGQKFYQNALTD